MAQLTAAWVEGKESPLAKNRPVPEPVNGRSRPRRIFEHFGVYKRSNSRPSSENSGFALLIVMLKMTQNE